MTYLVAGLGNPGPKYEHNRHNIGFRVVDELARRHALPAWRAKLGGEATSGTLSTGAARGRAVLLKPMEFMNHSGFAVQRTAAFHHVAIDHVIVIHDELDLDLGVVRLKRGGGHGGHNGLRSVMEQLGGGEFLRVRVGIGRDPRKPPGSKDAAAWVLSDFPASAADVVSAVISAACEGIEAIFELGIAAAMNRHNGRPSLADETRA